MTTKKQLMLATLALMTAFGAADAQVVNRALSFTSGGTVDCGRMPALDNLASYSVQFWINPTEWKADATVLSRGDDFKATLDDEGSVMFTVGTTSLKAVSTDLTTGDWSQLTLICNNGTATALVNGTQVATGTLSAIPAAETPLTLGGGYTGLVDEVRLWNDALNSEMATFDYFTNNTLNKWCPMWDNLLVYYKMDQGGCENLVDYKILGNDTAEYNNHGILGDGVTRVEANNDKMPYLINSAYTNNERFFDRTIPREQYLLSNDLIILAADVFASDGHIETKTPNNHAIDLTGTRQLDSFEGRDGVLEFDGQQGTRMTLPAATIPVGGRYTFETWLYLEEWTPGAYILRKENEQQTQGIAIYLGDADEQRVNVRINGLNYTGRASVSIPVGEWVHFAVAPGPGYSIDETVLFFKNGRQLYSDGEAPSTTGLAGETYAYLSTGSADIPIYIGENLKAKFDETCIWKTALSSAEVRNQMTTINVPSITKNVTVAEMDNVSGYYQFDDAEDPGFSTHSQDSWLKIMKGAYDGHAGVKFYLSVQGKYTADAIHGNWRNIVSDAKKRARFAQDLAELSAPYDGVELDLEWMESESAWNNYFVICDEIKETLPEGKIFRVSTHQSYRSYISSAKSHDYDGFTWQQYGPSSSLFSLSSFNTFITNILNNGYDTTKTMTSYSTTTSKGNNGSDVIGVKGNCLNNYTPSDKNVDTYTANGDTWSYMGPMQVYKRAKITRENNLQGIFYWDMGNDNWDGTPAAPIMPKYNLAKYCSYAINANNDTIVNTVDVRHLGISGIEEIAGGKKGSAKITVTPSPVTSTANVTLAGGETPEEITVYNMAGSAVINNNDKTGTIDAASLQQGVYLLQAKGADGKAHSTKFVKR